MAKKSYFLEFVNSKSRGEFPSKTEVASALKDVKRLIGSEKLDCPCDVAFACDDARRYHVLISCSAYNGKKVAKRDRQIMLNKFCKGYDYAAIVEEFCSTTSNADISIMARQIFAAF
jgi:hypothetical protein